MRHLLNIIWRYFNHISLHNLPKDDQEPQSKAPPLRASVASVKYLTELSQIQSRILEQQFVTSATFHVLRVSFHIW
jgi:hypothetical protein